LRASGLLLSLFLCCVDCQPLETTDDVTPSDTIPKYLSEYGIPVEEHWTVTDDGYILKLFRLSRPGAPVVLGQHGILCSSWHWLINEPSLSPGIQLYEQGYDVWLTNSRGSTYSRNHTTLEPAYNQEYWNFSWTDMGRFDVPANIQFVLEHTGRTDLTFAGWSQGTTQFFVAMTDDRLKAYLEKTVNLFVAIAPVTWLKHSKSKLLNALVTFHLADVIELAYPFAFLDGKNLPVFAQFLCKVTLGLICKVTVDLVVGRSDLDVSKAITNFTAHFPAGVSVKAMNHYAQLIDSGNFRDYDYGHWGNLREYGQDTPPVFDMQKATIPTALFVGSKDDLGDVKDNIILESHLPASTLVYSKVFEDFSHVTFFAGTEDAFAAWFPDMQLLLQKYNPLPTDLLV